MRIGLLVADEAERFFVKKELECITKDIEFSTLTSEKEARFYIENENLDAFATSENITTLKSSNPSDEIDWFSFSWYEDYPYNTIFFGKNGNKVITPPHADIESIHTINTADKYIFKNLTAADKLKSVISMLNAHNNTYAFIAPGRLAKYIKSEFCNALQTIKTQNIPLTDEVRKKEFSLFYKKGNKEISQLKPHFIKTVTFVGAGAGDASLCSLAGIEALKSAEVCFFDSLLDKNLLNYLPRNAIAINVGKRHHKHSVEQPKINQLIAEYAKEGYRVVRLKCGDPSIFGRLAEEISYIEQFNIPYKVIPGISSLSAMVSSTGIVLTRRGINRGFCVMSPIKHGGGFASVDIEERKKLPMIFFMGVRVVERIAKDLINEGYSKNTKAAMIFSIGKDNENIVKGTLETIPEAVSKYINKEHTPPGLFIVGEISGFEFKDFSLLKNQKILLAGERQRVEKLSIRLKDFGATTIPYNPKDVKKEMFLDIMPFLNTYGALAFSESSILKSFIKSFIEYFQDITKLPHIIASSKEVENSLKQFGILPHNKSDKNYKNILYIHSRKNGEFLNTLRKNGKVDEKTIHKIGERGYMHRFYTAVFLDSESFWDFVTTYGAEFIRNCFLWVKNDKEILSFINRQSITFNIIPEHLDENSTDIRFMLLINNSKNSKESIAI